jgi:hypothetical protein
MALEYPEHGWSLRRALAYAEQLGCTVWHPRRTGDVCVRHRSQTRSVRHNSRRTDSSRRLIVFLRAVADWLRGSR